MDFFSKCEEIHIFPQRVVHIYYTNPQRKSLFFVQCKNLIY